MADFNKIFVDSIVSINSYQNATLCFSDGYTIPRSSYSVTEDVVRLLNDALEDISVYYGYNTGRFFEFRLALVNYNTILSGVDSYGTPFNELPSNESQYMIFVNGTLLRQDQYAILDDKRLQVFVNLPSTQENVVQIYIGNKAIYGGQLPLAFAKSIQITHSSSSLTNVEINQSVFEAFVKPTESMGLTFTYMRDSDYEDEYYWTLAGERVDDIAEYGITYTGVPNVWDKLIVNYFKETTSNAQTYNIAYNKDTTIFFINGKKINFNNILEVASRKQVTTTISYSFKEGDILEYYVLDKTLSLHFNASPGFVDYFDKDYYNRKIPTIYNSSITLNEAASLLIDNIRPGFFIKEVNGNGCLVIVDSDLDAATVYCDALVPFTKKYYKPGEYYVEVPACRSIVEYLSDFDKKYKLLPEVLEVLQLVILKEVYDEAIRLKNMRSVTRVDSAYINKFIRFLGFDMDIKRLPLKKRREILEELDNYYRVVGTKNASNYFNMIESDWGIKSVDQLFTYHGSKLPNQREYIDFVRMQDTGAYEEHIEYRYPIVDYGRVNDIVAETLDFGLALDPDIDPNDPTLTEKQAQHVAKRLAEGYGEVTGRDYGWVYTPIKGKWVKWWKFDRPSNLYPTNHVVVDVDMKVGVQAEDLLDEFKNKFYNLVSTVLYIHKIIQSYVIGNDISAQTPGNIFAVDKMNHMGIMAAPIKLVQTSTSSNNYHLTNARLKEILDALQPEPEPDPEPEPEPIED